MSGDQGGHHDAHSLAASNNLTLEACYRGHLNHLLSSLTEHFYRRLRCVYVLCVAIQVYVWHRKGCDGNAVVQTGYRHGSGTLATLLGCGKTPLSPPESAPSHHNKTPNHMEVCRDATQCHSVGVNHSATDSLWASTEERQRDESVKTATDKTT